MAWYAARYHCAGQARLGLIRPFSHPPGDRVTNQSTTTGGYRMGYGGTRTWSTDALSIALRKRCYDGATTCALSPAWPGAASGAPASRTLGRPRGRATAGGRTTATAVTIGKSRTNPVLRSKNSVKDGRGDPDAPAGARRDECMARPYAGPWLMAWRRSPPPGRHWPPKRPPRDHYQ